MSDWEIRERSGGPGRTYYAIVNEGRPRSETLACIQDGRLYIQRLGNATIELSVPLTIINKLLDKEPR